MSTNKKSSAKAAGPRIQALMLRLASLIEQRENRRRFAQAIDALPHQISSWLSGRNCPSGETTLAIQEWMELQDNKNLKFKSTH